MASSDDEEEVVPQFVMGYYLVDENELPVPFSVLPIHFDDVENTDTVKKQVFLHGTADNGLQKVFKPVTAWKLGLQDVQPEVAVLSKDKKWIKLQKPRKSYEESIRSVLITIQMLHFLKNNPEASDKSLWDHLRKVFSMFEIRPSEDDLKDHLSLIKLFYEQDEMLAKSQLIPIYLKGKPRSKGSSEVAKKDTDLKQSFIAEDDEADDGPLVDIGDESEEESDLFDSVCAICDNGGELLCCEGRCMRSFHATRDVGTESDCKSLGYTRAQVKAIQNFWCKNCLYKQHQCFACGKLGSSDKSAGAEVFQCANATCGHFFHPKCVAELLFPDNEVEASEYQKKIASGETFTCPVHKCVVCKQGENKEEDDLQFAMCRRCPKSYHRKCLPRKIAFDDIEAEGIIQRAWEDLLPNRILIYCLKHKIDEDLGTPIRNHIIFPEAPERKKDINVRKSNVKAVVKKKVHVFGNLYKDQSSLKPLKATVKSSSSEESLSLGKSATTHERVLEPQKKVKPLKDGAQLHSHKAVDRSVSTMKPKVAVRTVSPTSTGKKLSSFNSSFPLVDGDMLKRVSALMEKTSTTLTVDDIIKKRTVPSTHSYSARHIEKTITHGKVEVSVEAVRTALQRLEDGSSVEDAKAVCEPEVVKQIVRWNNKLKVYLAPFLHGMRYTSFGRHFTKVDKLKEIADKLQWYVQSGDTIVDFCCGANDFSWVMKEKLESAGKKCSFKNYDVIQPKNDFAFERRDWMTVYQRELPTGSQLIMGLNPPFGVKAGLANKFIDKALTFKPKLIILIVPRETERLDVKKTPYDLIWDDEEFLSGKSFYLPGSVDVNDKQMEQWNLKPPPLYLWSRSDWTEKHKVIALKHGHTSKEQHGSVMEETQIDKPLDALPPKAHVEEVNESDREGNKNLEFRNKRKSPELDDGRQGNDDFEYGNKGQSNKNHKTRSRKKRKPKRKSDGMEGKKVDESSDMSISPPHGMEIEDHHPCIQIEDNHPPEAFETLSEKVFNHGSGSDFGLGSCDGWNTTAYEEVDEIARKYTFSGAAINRSSGGAAINLLSSELGGLDNGRSTEECFPSYIRENSAPSYIRENSAPSYIRENNADAYVRRPPYLSDYDGYDMQSRMYGIHGQDDLLQRNRLPLGGPDSSLGRGDIYSPASYGLPNPAVGSSAMQRYAPRLDETNYIRGGPLPGRSVGMAEVPGMRRDIPLDPRGYAFGLQRHFPDQGSSGWLND